MSATAETVPVFSEGSDRAENAGPAISPERYADILGGLELQTLEVDEVIASVDRFLIASLQAPPRVTVKTESECSVDDVLDVRATCTVAGVVGRRKCFRIAVTYRVRFSYSETPDEPFFDVFKALSLPMIVWPFFREAVHSLTLQMGLPPLTLPLQKAFAEG